MRARAQWMWSDDEQEFEKMMKQEGVAASSPSSLLARVRTVVSSLRATFHATLLPGGFPESVHECYVRFSAWQFVVRAPPAHTLLSLPP